MLKNDVVKITEYSFEKEREGGEKIWSWRGFELGISSTTADRLEQRIARHCLDRFNLSTRNRYAAWWWNL